MSDPQKIIDILLSSEIKGELLILFHRNPGLVDTIDGVARRIGRTGHSIDNDVQSLVNLGVLKTRKVGTSEVIGLDRSKDLEVLEAVADHVRTTTESRI